MKNHIRIPSLIRIVIIAAIVIGTGSFCFERYQSKAMPQNAGEATANSAEITKFPQRASVIKHLDSFEKFDAYNSSLDYFKGFTLSEEWINGKPYYQLLNKEKDVKILVDDKQKDAVIYHNGKSMDYDMEYLISWTSAHTWIDLLDVTGDGKEELIVRHELSSFDLRQGTCDVINLDSMTRYRIEDYIDSLSSRITVEPVKLTAGKIVCKVTDNKGNIYYGAAPASYENIEEYLYKTGENMPYYDIGIDYNRKCLTANTGIVMGLHNSGVFGYVCTTLMYNPETEYFELSEEFTVNLSEEIYYNNNIELPSGVSKIYMKDSNFGWALLEDGTLINTSDGWKSSLEMKQFTWNKEAVNVSEITYIDGILYVCGFMPVEKSIGIFRSEDGGNTWSTGYIDYSDVDGGPGQVFLSFTDGHSGYVLYCGGPALGLMTKVLYKTVDGGKTFDKVRDLSGSIDGYPTGLTFTEAGKGYITSTYHGNDNSYLYTTDDKGNSWTAVTLPQPEQLSDASQEGYMDGYPPSFWGDDGILIMAVNGDSKRSFITYVTSDGGSSWKQSGLIDIPSFAGFCFVDFNTVYMLDSMNEVVVLTRSEVGWK